MSDTPRLSEEQLDYIEKSTMPFCGQYSCDVLAALAELRALRAIAREIGSNTPTLDDERLPYVEVQIDRGSWEEVKRYAK